MTMAVVHSAGLEASPAGLSRELDSPAGESRELDSPAAVSRELDSLAAVSRELELAGVLTVERAAVVNVRLPVVLVLDTSIPSLFK